tara:strand:+ start:3076 stop:4014 length:939 start_codon:yes stop_codon:yes gene_type:complete
MGIYVNFTPSNPCYKCESHSGIKDNKEKGRCHGVWFPNDPPEKYNMVCTNKRISQLDKDDEPLKYIEKFDGWWHRIQDCKCGFHEREMYGAPLAIQTHRVDTKSDNDKRVKTIWNSSVELMNNNAALYLMSRGIRIKPDALRFNKYLYYSETKKEEECLVAKVTDVNGDIKGLQRIYLSGSRKHTEGIAKMSLGSILGNAVKFGSVGNILGIAEGIEDALSLHQVLKIPVWAALGSHFMRQLEFPDSVRKLIIFGDGDDAGDKAVKDCLQSYRGRYHTSYYKAPNGKDFNDLLMEDSSGNSIMNICTDIKLL